MTVFCEKIPTLALNKIPYKNAKVQISHRTML